MKQWLSKSIVSLCLVTMGAQATDIAKTMELSPGEVVVAQGKIAYSKPWGFDYDKDGTQNYIVMGAHLFIKKTKEGEYKGFLERGLFDIDKNVSIGWYLKRSLLQQAPMVRDISVKNVEQNGTTVTFDIEKTTFTVIDGGQGHIRDKVILNDHIKKPRDVKIFDGDLEVIPPK